MRGSVREFVTPQRQRQAYLKGRHERGYMDGFYDLGEHPPPSDPEAEAVYRTGLRIGRRERARGAA